MYTKVNQILPKFKLMEESEFNKICEECKKEDETVRQNLVIHGYKICDSCKLSKTIFPI